MDPTETQPEREERPRQRSIPARRKFSFRALRNALRMGHCAPAVMATACKGGRAEYESRVKLTAGLPGGIGMRGAECGCVTAPLLFLGLVHGGDGGEEDSARVVALGRRYLSRFRENYAGATCREITGISWDDAEAVKKKGLGAFITCLRAITGSPGILRETLEEEDKLFGADEKAAAAHAKLWRAFRDEGFHCSQSVLSDLEDVVDGLEEGRRASCGLLGGTALRGMTCSALAAGVLALGAARGEIENSYLRVMRWMSMAFTALDKFMSDEGNKFNRAINLGAELASWFEGEFGSTRCAEIVGADLSSPAGVEAYVAKGGPGRCREIARAVASRLREILAHAPEAAPAEE
ncbi:MAG: C_GCAxxG_C_C family protein [Candidatus Coatesbacteria bacterium]|nr:MAG: C_GCAxxG_C_C family protein [Candidatus Coatesbacteria bacterium]